MKNRKWQRVLSWILTLTMLLGTFEGTGFAVQAVHETRALGVSENGSSTISTQFDWTYGTQVSDIVFTATSANEAYSDVTWTLKDANNEVVTADSFVEGMTFSQENGVFTISGTPAEVMTTSQNYTLSVSDNDTSDYKDANGASNTFAITVAGVTATMNTDDKIFNTAVMGYTVSETAGENVVVPEEKTISVAGVASANAITDVTVSLSGNDANCFTATLEGDKLDKNSPMKLVVAPVEGLEAKGDSNKDGYYEATVTVSSNCFANSPSFDVKFNVTSDAVVTVMQGGEELEVSGVYPDYSCNPEVQVGEKFDDIVVTVAKGAGEQVVQKTTFTGLTVNEITGVGEGTNTYTIKSSNFYPQTNEEEIAVLTGTVSVPFKDKNENLTNVTIQFNPLPADVTYSGKNLVEDTDNNDTVSYNLAWYTGNSPEIVVSNNSDIDLKELSLAFSGVTGGAAWTVKADGTVVATSATSGTFSISANSSVKLVVSANQAATANLTINGIGIERKVFALDYVNNANVQITTTNSDLPEAKINEAYDTNLEASYDIGGETAELEWSLCDSFETPNDAKPYNDAFTAAGFVLSKDGVITNTKPLKAGTYEFCVKVEMAASTYYDVKPLQIVVKPLAKSNIVVSKDGTAIDLSKNTFIGDYSSSDESREAVEFVIQNNAAVSVNMTVTAGNKVTVSPNSLSIAAGESAVLSVKAVSMNASACTDAITLNSNEVEALSFGVSYNVAQAPVISTVSVNYTVNAAGSNTLSANYVTAGKAVWSCEDDTLPAGLTLSANGVLSGTATETFDGKVEFTVTDSATGLSTTGEVRVVVGAEATVTLYKGPNVLAIADGVYPITFEMNGTEGCTINIRNNGTMALSNISIVKEVVNSEKTYNKYAGADAFVLSTSSIADIAAKETESFDISLKDGVAAGTYVATVTIKGAQIDDYVLKLYYVVTDDVEINAAETVFEVGKAISENATLQLLTVSGGEVLGTANEGTETANTELTQVVTYDVVSANTALTGSGLQLNEEGQLVAESENGNAPVKSGTYKVYVQATVKYQSGDSNLGITTATELTSEVYPLTIVVNKSSALKVSAASAEDKNADAACGQKVLDADKNIISYQIGEVASGYAADDYVLTLTVSNNSVINLADVAVAAEDENLVVSTASENIASDNTRTYTISPKTGLAKGSYTTNLLISGPETETITFPVSFEVVDPVIDFSVIADGAACTDTINLKANPVENENDYLTALSVSNNGNVSMNVIIEEVKNANGDSFDDNTDQCKLFVAEKSPSMFTKAAPGVISDLTTGVNSVAFDIRANDVSKASTDVAYIKVTASRVNGSATEKLSKVFKVQLNVVETVTMVVTPSAAKSYITREENAAVEGYTAKDYETAITVTNNSDDTTLYGLEAEITKVTVDGYEVYADFFTLSSNAADDLAAGASAGFTITPIKGLSYGKYTVTIEFTADNASKTVTRSFEFNVKAADSITLDIDYFNGVDVDTKIGERLLNALALCVESTDLEDQTVYYDLNDDDEADISIKIINGSSFKVYREHDSSTSRITDSYTYKTTVVGTEAYPVYESITFNMKYNVLYNYNYSGFKYTDVPAYLVTEYSMEKQANGTYLSNTNVLSDLTVSYGQTLAEAYEEYLENLPYDDETIVNWYKNLSPIPVLENRYYNGNIIVLFDGWTRSNGFYNAPAGGSSATFSAEDKIYNDTICSPAYKYASYSESVSGNVPGAVSWNWTVSANDMENKDADYTASATVSLNCVTEGWPEDELEDAMITVTADEVKYVAAESRDRTCSQNTIRVFTATVKINQPETGEVLTYTDTYTYEGSETDPHTYEVVVGDWYEQADGSWSISVNNVCKVCGDILPCEVTVTHEVTTAPTMNTEGVIIYKASFKDTVKNETHELTNTKTAAILPLYNYINGNGTWTWTEKTDGGYNVSVSFNATIPTGETYGPLTYNESSKDYPVKVSSVKLADGTTEYTAEITIEGKRFYEVKNPELDTTIFDLSTAKWSWEKSESGAYVASLTVTDSRGKVHTFTPTVTSTMDGRYVNYTASITLLTADGEQTISDTKRVLVGEENVEATGELVAVFAEDLEWTGSEEGKMVYTGVKIMPAVVVKNGDVVLKSGIDYTISYKNNIKVGTASVMIKGKGSYSKTFKLNFTIEAKNVEDDDVMVGGLTVASNTKTVKPVVTYYGKKLSLKKDYTLTANGDELTITGVNNFTGTKTVSIARVDNKQLEKIKVSIAKGTSFIYDGEAHELTADQLIVTGAKSKAALEADQYTVSYSDNVNAGTVKVTVTAIGGEDSVYTGTVTKSFKITGATNAKITIEDLLEDGYSFKRAGVTPTLDITAVLASDKEETLVLGKDYTVKYANNKAVGTGKITVTYIGNYKGVAKQTVNFKIVPAVLDSEAVVIAPEFVTMQKSTKASKYMLKNGKTLNVQINGMALKSNEFTASYFKGDTALAKNATVAVGDEITVKIALKNAKNFAIEEGTELSATYTIVAATGTDITGFKVMVLGADGKTAKVGYTGAPITFDADNESRQGNLVLKKGKTVIDLGDEEVASHFTVQYANNVDKGTAYVVVNAVEGDETYSGFAGGTFKIKANVITDNMNKEAK